VNDDIKPFLESNKKAVIWVKISLFAQQ